jgi:hypothetical protein
MSDFSRAPVVKLTFLLDNFFYGTSATGYHVTNVFLHLCNTFLATYTFRLLLKYTVLDEQKAKSACYFFFFLFLLSPVHSEPLCYLLGRAGLLVTFFCILSFLFFLKANFKNQVLLIISLLFFSLGLLSYEISWTFPVIILFVANYLRNYQPLPAKKIFGYTVPFFAVCAVCITARLLISNHKTTPYGNDIFLSLNPMQLFKNVAALFFRNFIPPFENTLMFIIACIVAATIFFYVLSMIRNRNIGLLFFAVLLMASCFVAYAPAIAFGISSHNSESERYIYFSSVFAMMFLSIGISLFDRQTIKQVALLACCCIYGWFLFATINSYVNAGKFSQEYLKLLSEVHDKAKQIYLVNQPSQYRGALLFRAYSDEPGSSQKNFYTIRDFMQALYEENNSEYITVSKKEIPEKAKVERIVRIAADSLPSVFEGFYLNEPKKNLINYNSGDSIYYDRNSSMIIGLKLPSLYIFK